MDKFKAENPTMPVPVAKTNKAKLEALQAKGALAQAGAHTAPHNSSVTAEFANQQFQGQLQPTDVTQIF